jgi:NAD(P)H-hydrate repair Nnr-like enzyme with NAD(P)H-hydrate dehydratase domain
MGDVLSGIIAALLGQGLPAFEAARSGVYIHALCAEFWSRDRDQSGLLAGDIIDHIPLVMRQLRDSG